MLMMPAALLLSMLARPRLSRKQMKIFSRCLRRKDPNPSIITEGRIRKERTAENDRRQTRPSDSI